MICEISKKCGGCQFINQDYQKSLEYKNSYMKALFKDFHVAIHPIIGMHNPYGYRNKVIVAFNKNYEYGLYQEHSHHIVPYSYCLLHDELTDSIIHKIALLLKKYRVSIYDPRTCKGEIRHVLIRRSYTTKQYMIVLVSTKTMLKGSRNFSREIVKEFPQVKTIVLNTNTRDTVVVLGEKETVLYGKGFIIDYLCDLSFKISAKSFYQINHEQCEILYKKALSLLSIRKDDIIYDTYSGIGTIGMIAAKYAKRVYSIEKNKQAVKDAKINQAFNNLINVYLIQDDAGEYMIHQMKQNVSADIIIMDPPRSGSSLEFIQASCQLGPREILYISCNPETQIRDLKIFKNYGYYFKDIYSIDMFPFTNGIESITVLRKH